VKLITEESAKSKKVKVQFKSDADVPKQHRGLKGKVIERTGSPHYPANTKDAVVYEVALSGGGSLKNVPGRWLNVITK
jgi:hypothetical protein